MRVIVTLALCCFFLFLQVQSKKLKICIPTKKKLSDLGGEHISFEKTLAKLREEKDEVNITGTFPIHLDLPDAISCDVILTDLTISGFLDTSICLFPSLRVPVNITINTLKIQGKNYKLQCTVSNLMDLHGDGEFEMNLEGVSFAVTNLLPAIIPINCWMVNLETKLQKMTAKFDNMMDGDEVLQLLINEVIGDLAPDFVDYYWPKIYDAMEPLIQKIIDKYVNKVELGNLLARLSKETGLQKDIKKICYNL
ncbi:uncharacterized protein LOC123315770 [Coccinella septempunctata]|uniref:uncharacterized protein LOC123315770 n=1 Tax=Coccinella septempunctata TaxID=41139 RepID=UPI001D06CF4F|nr:uncharacterized protein LOC123315770 [Coccinella septempunctata]